MFGNLASIIRESTIALKWRKKERKNGEIDRENEKGREKQKSFSWHFVFV